MLLKTLVEDPSFCLAITFLFFWVFSKLSGFISNGYIRPLFNPILFTGATIIAFYQMFGLDLSYYSKHINILTFFFPLATMLMAINVFRYRAVLYRYFWVLFISVGVGSYVSLKVAIIGLSLFQLDHIFYLPSLFKSITSSFALAITNPIDVSAGSLVLFAVIVSGICGAVFVPIMVKIFKMENHFVSWGIATGTSSHIVGTSQAMQMNSEAGSISSVALSLAGLWTLIFFQILFR